VTVSGQGLGINEIKPAPNDAGLADQLEEFIEGCLAIVYAKPGPEVLERYRQLRNHIGRYVGRAPNTPNAELYVLDRAVAHLRTAGRSRKRRAADLAANDAGESIEQIAARTGRKPGSVEKNIKRAQQDRDRGQN
jgi:hypothetical protein